jgi:hypothetical protein
MEPQKFYTPLKIGLLAVVTAYFLFTLHGMFTLSWIGEWEPLHEPIRTIIFVEDISATTCLAFRFLASIIAFSATIIYFVKKDFKKQTAYKVIRWVLVFEGIYWLGLLTTAGYSVQGFWNLLLQNRPLGTLLNSLIVDVIPTLMESIVLPIGLFILAFKVNSNKPIKLAVKWSFITGTIFIVVFWLTNTSSWLGIVGQAGTEYLTAHPEHLVSFVSTVFGLLALTIYTGYIAKKSARTESLEDLKLGRIGIIITSLGVYFLWNYFSWVFLAGNTWNYWYAWFLGHNMDLWMLALPLLGLPLLFEKGDVEKKI